MSKTFDQESSASLSRQEALARDRQLQEQRAQVAQAEAAQRTEQLQRAQDYIERLNAQLEHMQARIEALHERVGSVASAPASDPQPVPPPVVTAQPAASPESHEPSAPAKPWSWLAAGVLVGGLVVGGLLVSMRLQPPTTSARRPAATIAVPVPRLRSAPTPSLLPASKIQAWTPPHESLITVTPGQATPTQPEAEPVTTEPRRGTFRI